MKPAKILALLLCLATGISSAVATETPETSTPPKKAEKTKKTNKPKQKVPAIPLDEAIKIATTPTLSPKRAKRLEKKKKIAEKNKENINGTKHLMFHRTPLESYLLHRSRMNNAVQFLSNRSEHDHNSRNFDSASGTPGTRTHKHNRDQYSLGKFRPLIKIHR